ncbi:hypothetical protein AGMMS50293_10650 [Spirochaetia bacterium]|nr:hypothetical protein AGMMS50293_10650 [Spirochaetia bacterium]
MQATYRLRADEITNNFLMGLKNTYQGREIEITVQEVEDETAYLLKTETNRKNLLEALEAERKGEKGRSFTLAQLEELSV